MKTKSIAIIVSAAILSAFLMVPSTSWAGSPQSHRWEGVAIGVGAAIVGSALIRAMHPQTPEIVSHRPVFVEPRYQPQHRQAGHWEIRKEWVAPTYQRAWQPSHYDRRGNWVPGRWVQWEASPGHWVETRVWVAYR